MTRLLSYGVLAITALAGLLLVLLFSLDLGRFRHIIEPLASSALGRELAIQGPVHLHFGRTITVVAQGVSLGNPAWAEDPLFLAFDALELEIDVASLLHRKIVIENLRLHGMNLDLESRLDGPANWSLATDDNNTSEAPDASEEFGIPLLIKKALIVATRVEFSGPMVSAPVLARIEHLTQTINDAGFLEARLTAFLNDAPVNLHLEIGDATELQNLGEVAAVLSGSAGEISFSGDGQVAQLSSLTSPRANFRLEGPSFRYLAELLTLRTEADGPLEMDMSLIPGETGHRVEIETQLATVEARIAGSLPDLFSLHGATLTAHVHGRDFAGFEAALGLPPGKPGPFEARFRVNSKSKKETDMSFSAEVAGIALDAQGNTRNLRTGLVGSAFKLRWRAPSLATSLAALDITSAPRIGMTGSADVRVTHADKLSAEYVVSLGDNALRGTAGFDFSDPDWTLDSPFAISLPSPEQLLPPSEDPVVLPEALKGLELQGLFTANREHSRIQQLTVPGDLLSLILEAEWPTYDPLEAPSLTLSGGGEQLSALLDGLPPELNIPFKLQGNISRGDGQHVLAQLDLSAEHINGRVNVEFDSAAATPSIEAAVKATALGSDVSGDVTYAMSEPPRLDVSLQSGLLNLRPWLPAEEPVPPEREPLSGDKRMIPDVTVSAVRLPNLEGTLVYRADRVEAAAEHIEELYVGASLEDPRLIVNKLAFRGQGGGTITAAGGMEVLDAGLDTWVRLQGDNVSIGMPAQDPAEVALLPRYDVSLAYTGKGETLREMASGSHGYLRFASGPGKIDVSAMQLFTGDIMVELLNTVNPFSKKEKYSNIECSVFQATVENGVLVGEPLLVVESDKLHILAEARLDLRDERIEADFNTVPKKGLGIGLSNLINPYVHLGGTLAAPVLGVDSDSALVSGGATIATGGLSILAKGVWDRMSLEEKSCEAILARGQKEFDRLESLYGSGARGGAAP